MEMFEIPLDLCYGSLLDKNYRNKKFGIVSGGSGSIRPEKYQKEMIEKITGIPILHTKIRINLRRFQLEEKCRPNVKIDGFDFSENFDGVQVLERELIFINLKCIVGKGGSQTRSLREVYWFMEGQIKTLLQNTPLEPIYFANILDGDEAAKNIEKFHYLLSQPEYKTIKHKIYVGDLKNYFCWLKSIM